MDFVIGDPSVLDLFVLIFIRFNPSPALSLLSETLVLAAVLRRQVSSTNDSFDRPYHSHFRGLGPCFLYLLTPWCLYSWLATTMTGIISL